MLVNGDRRSEPDEMFFVNLSNARNADIADGVGVGVIVNDEPSVSISSATGQEGNAGGTPFDFTVTLSSAYDMPVTLNFATANGTAKAGSRDYRPKSGRLVFAPGETSKTIAVIVNGDERVEPAEWFFVRLTSSRFAAIARGQGVGTILDDDDARIDGGCNANAPCSGYGEQDNGGGGGY